ncbi:MULTISPECIES: Tol-Pal system beta propeller repeat protein TolB [unclassified Herbaspirillum]|uniref:Tol-Pal system beta propeller repeat protein TolB n=1 Tax=unclassified Herbaspirillum TaxID=2624150 RepID=UPI0011545FA5|nr:MULTISPECIES: Tol-Pal system beta propeller repeat protein TolB [unclassified Herbaspirillum]MBB5391693.1 TolB protein [Herbaspirillum sp. SJZ102]TQK03060.1 TolB protein [Herbaspirillum sp. SJZ130]TQK06552.1 TolB protein [Herbaspirillum sp. SJZ106]TWC62387.1 TolB protein [Herbaspirillum sp. SJZ099]
MINVRYLTSIAVTAASLSFAPASQAQLRFEITGVGATQIPVAVAAFPGEEAAPQQITSIVKADLARSGIFKLIDNSDALSDSSVINYADWQKRGANALAVGSVQRLADGRFDVRYRLFDTVQSSQLSALSFGSQPQLIRLTAHKIADDIYQKLTGIPGIFSTRISYVTKSGSEYRLEVADADGEGRQVALISNEPIISPAWSPDGTKVAYVSFEAKKPIIYIQNLVTRQRSVVANFKGSNSAPSWSPDGSRLAVALSRDGLTQVYIINADGSGLRRLTNTSGIDTEPRFSPDGGSIYFTSDRSGGPQIYKVGVDGGSAQRVTFNGSYNISPRISPDGKTLAFISRRDGQFQLYALDLTNGQEQRLSDGSRDQSPSFAPNGKYIMYATEAGRRGSLAIVSVDGRVKQRLTTQVGDIREPTWGPFMK